MPVDVILDAAGQRNRALDNLQIALRIGRLYSDNMAAVNAQYLPFAFKTGQVSSFSDSDWSHWKVSREIPKLLST